MVGSTKGRRAPRGTLSRSRIIGAALELIDDEGVDGLSMPKLARRLDVGVMSLYSHVDSRDDLLDAVVEAVLRELPFPSGSDWRDRIRSHFVDLRTALLSHPGLGTVFATKNVAVPAVLDLLEAHLAELTGAGLDDEQSVQLYYSLLTYTLGFTAWEIPRSHSMTPEEYAEQWRRAVGSLDRAGYPTLHRLLPTLTTVAGDRQFRVGLEWLINAAGQPA